jgi:hypothetical protein
MTRIQVRVRRITIEDAFVAVPITSAVTKEEPDGSVHVDGAAVFREAVRIAADPSAQWQAESVEIVVHPMQCPRPEDRELLYVEPPSA